MIRRLEDQLGTKLLNRTKRSVSLTEAGSELANPASDLLDDWVPRGALYLYYYNPTGLPRKLRVFIDFVHERLK